MEIIEKFNIDYLEVLDLQLSLLEKVREDPSLSFFILCSHPPCFTLGKGLQKVSELNLTEFDPRLKERLPFPLHEIKRGGGLTFHHPGQLICYPIVNLNKKKRDVYRVMNVLLKTCEKVLKEKFQLEGLCYKNKLLGLWHEEKKLASIGLAVSHYVTYHGLALNILKNEAMSKALLMVNPCGLPGTIYTEVEALVDFPKEKLYEEFLLHFKQGLIDTSYFK